jgi:hypothetical protein
MRAEINDEVRQIDFDSVSSPTDQLLDDSLEQSAQFGSRQSPGGGGRLVDWAGADTLTRAVEDFEESSMEGDQVDRRQLADGMVMVSQVEFMHEKMASGGEGGNSVPAGNRTDSREDSLVGLPLDVSLGDDSSAHQWSAPILFYPDGRASDAQLSVVDPSGYAIEVAVVGISGKVHVGDRRRLPEGARITGLSLTVPSEALSQGEMKFEE